MGLNLPLLILFAPGCFISNWTFLVRFCLGLCCRLLLGGKLIVFGPSLRGCWSSRLRSRGMRRGQSWLLPNRTAESFCWAGSTWWQSALRSTSPCTSTAESCKPKLHRGENCSSVQRPVLMQFWFWHCCQSTSWQFLFQYHRGHFVDPQVWSKPDCRYWF